MTELKLYEPSMKSKFLKR